MNHSEWVGRFVDGAGGEKVEEKIAELSTQSFSIYLIEQPFCGRRAIASFLRAST